MLKLLRILGATGALAALLVLHGAHWAALQTFAWGRMMLQYSQTESLGAALAKTLDGKHPCSLCRTVAANAPHNDASKAHSAMAERSSEVFWELRFVLPPPPPRGVLEEHSFVPISHCEFTDSPPSPPPRQRC
jgi:hypothetical protein